MRGACVKCWRSPWLPGADPGCFAVGGVPLRNGVTDWWHKQLLLANTKKKAFDSGNKIMWTAENTYRMIQQILHNCEVDCTVLIAFAERHPKLVARKNRDFCDGLPNSLASWKNVAVLGTNHTKHMTHFSTNTRWLSVHVTCNTQWKLSGCFLICLPFKLDSRFSWC